MADIFTDPGNFVSTDAVAPVLDTSVISPPAIDANVSGTGVGTGGTRAVVTGNISKLRTSMGTSLMVDAGICTTAALGAGTKTIDHATSNMGAVAFGIGTGAITTALILTFLPHTALFDADGEGMHPLVCAQNE